MDLLTDQLNTLITTGLSSSWNSVPGGLDKVSASSMGFAWGIGNNKLWMCQLPCAGNWKEVSTPASVLDITTDDTNVYVLFQSKLGIKSASNVDEWIIVDVPNGITKIVSTGSYIWGQSGNQKMKLPKPGTTGNWITVDDPKNIRITSASSNALYGVDSTGAPMKTDESLQSGWTSLPEFSGKYNTLIGDADQTAIYGIDTTNQLQRCSNGKCNTVDSNGFVPQNLTIEPITKQLWMTTTTSNDTGNILNKNDSSDFSSILQASHPLEKQRDDIVVQTKTDYQQNTAATMLEKQLQSIKSVLSKTFNINISAKKISDTQTQQLTNSISDITQQIQQLEQSTPILHNIIMIIFGISIIYLFGTILGWITHILVIVLLISGIIYYLRNK
jgi:hypothetical protein